MCIRHMLVESLEGGGRKVGENKLLTAKKARMNPYTKDFKKCRICKQSVHQIGSHYCQACAYKNLKSCNSQDPWIRGARNTTEGGGRKVGENKLLTAKKARMNPYTKDFKKCRICKQSVHQIGSHYCQACAYKVGICAMCGKKIIDTKNYKQSSV
eukprot:XP_011671811.1 PREDICTED: cysteine-rich PDZ-binding protein [Strongylocentrotus purpuratus]